MSKKAGRIRCHFLTVQIAVIQMLSHLSFAVVRQCSDQTNVLHKLFAYSNEFGKCISYVCVERYRCQIEICSGRDRV